MATRKKKTTTAEAAVPEVSVIVTQSPALVAKNVSPDTTHRELLHTQTTAATGRETYELVKLDADGNETGRPFTIGARTYHRSYKHRTDFKLKKN